MLELFTEERVFPYCLLHGRSCPNTKVSPSHISAEIEANQEQKETLARLEMYNGKVRADRSSHFCLSDIPLKKLACP